MKSSSKPRRRKIIEEDVLGKEGVESVPMVEGKRKKKSRVLTHSKEEPDHQEEGEICEKGGVDLRMELSRRRAERLKGVSYFSLILLMHVVK